MSQEEERVPVSLENEMLKLEDTTLVTEAHRKELLDKMMAVARGIKIDQEELANKGSREAITAAIKMTSDLLNDTENSQHKRIQAKTRLKEAAGNDKIAEAGIEILKQLSLGDSRVDRELPVDLENVELKLEEGEKIPDTMLKTDPNDIS